MTVRSVIALLVVVCHFGIIALTHIILRILPFCFFNSFNNNCRSKFHYHSKLHTSISTANFQHDDDNTQHDLTDTQHTTHDNAMTTLQLHPRHQHHGNRRTTQRPCLLYRQDQCESVSKSKSGRRCLQLASQERVLVLRTLRRKHGTTATRRTVHCHFCQVHWFTVSRTSRQFWNSHSISRHGWQALSSQGRYEH